MSGPDRAVEARRMALQSTAELWRGLDVIDAALRHGRFSRNRQPEGPTHMTGPATTDPTPYTVWIDYGSEGWSPHECATVADCLDTISQYSGQGYRITRTVTLIDPDATPTPATAAPSGPGGEHTTATGCTVSVHPVPGDLGLTLLALDMRQPGDGRHAEVLLSPADRAAIRELLQ